MVIFIIQMFIYIYIKPKLILPVQNCHKGSWKKKKKEKVIKSCFTIICL